MSNMDGIMSCQDEHSCSENEDTRRFLPNEIIGESNHSPMSTARDTPTCSNHTQMEQKMRRKLQFFFMNPIEKWQAKRRFPYKFVVQVIKIVLVTFQLCFFAHNRYNHVNYTWDNRISFSHLFLKEWDSTREIDAYPPGAGPLAIYQVEEFYDTLDFACNGYANLANAIGSYSYNNEDNNMTNPELCIFRYTEGTVFGFNESYIFNSEINKNCVTMTQNKDKIYDTKAVLSSEIMDFSAIVKAVLSFSVKTVNFKAAGPITPPDCYRFDIQIVFDNEDQDGQMQLELDADAVRLVCHGGQEYVTDNKIDQILRSILNIFVIIICTISFALCSRAIYRAQLLKEITVNFFRKAYKKELSIEGKFEFLNLWYIMIIINDILIIMGSAIKEQIERKHFINDQWNLCSVFLGTGNLLVWFGVLRYLGFFKTYNVVILTLKKATPKISRFLLCALLIYAGFTFCGWLILGPYHMKFRSLATTSECLFSLINGDDMFATFSIMSHKSPMLWWYSRVYLYSFISLYIYVVLSLFISVIMDAYDTIKQYYSDGFPKSDLQTFVGQTCLEDLSSGLYRVESSASLNALMSSLCCCSYFRSTYSKLDGTSSTARNTATNAANCIL